MTEFPTYIHIVAVMTALYGAFFGVHNFLNKISALVRNADVAQSLLRDMLDIVWLGAVIWLVLLDYHVFIASLVKSIV